MERRQKMSRITALVGAAMLAATALSAGPALAHHADECDAMFLNACWDGWDVPSQTNPLWWNDGALPYGHAEDNNRPVWLHLETAAPSDAPFEITFTVKQGVVGSIDVYEVRHDDASADRQITPDCPQTFATELALQDGERVGGYATRVTWLTLTQHQTVVPVDSDAGDDGDVNPNPKSERTVKLDLPRDQEWVVVFDARAGTDQGDELDEIGGHSSVSYRVNVDDGFFHGDKLRPPSEPLDSDTWRSNGQECLSFTPLPNG